MSGNHTFISFALERNRLIHKFFKSASRAYLLYQEMGLSLFFVELVSDRLTHLSISFLINQALFPKNSIVVQQPLLFDDLVLCHFFHLKTMKSSLRFLLFVLLQRQLKRTLELLLSQWL